MSLKKTHRRVLAPLAAASILGLALTGCTGDVAAGDKENTDCSDYETYGTFDGGEVSISGTIVDAEADRLLESWADFETCTGIDISYQGTKEFEAQIAVLAEAGNAPDIGIVPQPGLLQRLATGGWLQPAPEAVEANVDEFWGEDWKTYGSHDGTFYAAPLMASVKGFVWYSPTDFEEKGYEVPETLDELTALSEQIVADGQQPWCVGFGSGDATGWPGTDWVEDYVLRQAGADVYDQWINHEIPFNDPQIVAAFDAVGEIIKNPDMVNGGLGDVSSVISTEMADGGLPILDGECSMHHQASFYEGFWPEGTEVSPDGDVFAFLLPSVEAGGETAVTGGGEFPVAFNEGEEVDAVRAYLSSDTWANIRVSLGGVISANKGLDPENASSDVLKESIEILQGEDTVFRFDGSDLMPAAVGADSFFKGIVAWVSGDSTQETVDAIESSWPQD
ncbi:ABC transporter substrate-binding protein [Mycetocola zhujimingii]|uniref:Carbohydrate ABC transporter substrate-binding protein n=1 Tax=Mycetocola zhujimingii TaxID=2079792 RepID=A0A2U1TAA9_9MICO|nr:ABC transporter substrate-binding protein [Mycetocola zhujimingii]AWB85567.1 sugar ABC transporter substrate-binding protein [Mycetocola zhujimingii]PWC04537.1 carbohydrate ABC transporter substrate-binding protein [Mycetocola zhujimingii]